MKVSSTSKDKFNYNIYTSSKFKNLTLASCLDTKSTKANPRCGPVPVSFLGNRILFSSPNTLLNIHVREFVSTNVK
jgi:hypothetical protein